MALFTDTITIITQVPADEWLWDTFCFEISEIGGYQIVVIEGVQWSDKTEKVIQNGIVSLNKYASVTFPEGVYEHINFEMTDEEMSIFFGKVVADIRDEKGYRVSDLLKKYSKSGLIKSVNDNTNRTFLKNIKVVVGYG